MRSAPSAFWRSFSPSVVGSITAATPLRKPPACVSNHPRKRNCRSSASRWPATLLHCASRCRPTQMESQRLTLPSMAQRNKPVPLCGRLPPTIPCSMAPTLVPNRSFFPGLYPLARLRASFFHLLLKRMSTLTFPITPSPLRCATSLPI